jgi:hypothetical protein
MKVFIIGGSSGDAENDAKLKPFCENLGELLGNSEHQIILCSEHESSADRSVIEGLRKSTGYHTDKKVIVHRPDDSFVREKWRALEKDIGLLNPEYHSHKGPELTSKEGRTLAFLLCQIQALNDCDVVVSMGGREDGSAVLLLAIAREQGRMIIPYRFMEGASERVYNQIEGELRARLGLNLVEKLSEPNEGSSVFLEILGRLGGKYSGTQRIFLSYAWKCSEYADSVEVFLRRLNNVTVFRDERDVNHGESINQKIEKEIQFECNVFIALWCREYAESPYCHDELELWIKYRRQENLYLLRFDDTRPVWPSLRETPDNRETFRAKWPRVDLKNRGEIEKILWEILNVV